MDDYKPFLNVYVIWHPTFDEDHKDVSVGQTIAGQIYSSFARDLTRPTAQSLGMPVFFRSVSWSANGNVPPPAAIDLTQAERNLIIILIDARMVNSDPWNEYVGDLHAKVEATGGSSRILPVSLAPSAFNINDSLAEKNFIRYHTFKEEQRSSEFLLWLTHEAGRFLNQEQVEGVAKLRPIKLFISHAKQDGVPLAEQFRAALKDTPVDKFFDTVDIAPGSDFAGQIADGIRDSTLLVLQSDAYSSRPWCRQEILLAKKHRRPIVVVNAVDQEEVRSFPYIGNVPVIRWTGRNALKILSLALREQLRFLFAEGRTKALQKAGRIPPNACVLMRPPEVLDLPEIALAVGKGGAETLIVYPDPPLGAEENILLAGCGEGVSFTTLIMPQPRTDLSKKVIGLSISDSSDLMTLGLSDTHVKAAFTEFSAQLLARGANIAYGGDHRQTGFTQILFDVVRTHNSSGSTNKYFPIMNFVSWPLHLKMDDDYKANLRKIAKLKCEELPSDVAADQLANKDVYLEPDSPANRYVWARCLTDMRRHMNEQCDIRVLMGGRLEGYAGKYPGLLEEAWYALESKKPLFLIGAFGGCTKAIIDWVTGSNPESLTLEYQTSNPEYAALVNLYNEKAAANPNLNLAPINYRSMREIFANCGSAGLGNGLSVAENTRLFNTTDLDEIVYLVLKGLDNLS
jgi:SLOG cluster2/TIR domain